MLKSAFAMPMRARPSRPVEIYQIKVTLRRSHPPIWRRIRVRSDTTLAKLHNILQRVMGWEDAHLHQFLIRGQDYGMTDQREGETRKAKDERNYTLGDLVAGVSAQFVYHYDFGDNWEHVLVVEETLPPEDRVSYPVCLAGARACPPEDVGGISGYENFLAALRDPQHPEHQEYLGWIDGDFDPEALNLNKVNRLLRAMR